MRLPAGGWTCAETPERFAEFSSVGRRLGDRLYSTAPINEPWCVAWLSHYLGQHAPGLTDLHRRGARHAPRRPRPRALAWRPFARRTSGNVGAVCNMEYALPATDADADAPRPRRSTTASTTAGSRRDRRRASIRKTSSRGSRPSARGLAGRHGRNLRRRSTGSASTTTPASGCAAKARRLAPRRHRATDPCRRPTWAGRSARRASTTCCGGRWPTTPARRRSS